MAEMKRRGGLGANEGAAKAPRIVMAGEASLARRTLLRGAARGAAALFCLPWLEAMWPSARASLGAPSAPAAPKRLIWIYVPNGVQREHWKPEAGPLAELPSILEPLAPWRERLQVLSGLTADKARANGDGPGDHARATAAFLTGVQPLKADGQVRLGISADQVVADAIEGQTPWRSIAVGCENARTEGQCDSGYACAYQSHISWRGETTPVFKETRPTRLFDRLFRGGRSELGDAERARQRSVLDLVGRDLERLSGRLGNADRAKLDEYATGLRDLERRLERLAEASRSAPALAAPEGDPSDLAERIELFHELIALALRLDLTRVATFLVTNEGSNRVYRELGQQEGHHSLSHHQGDGDKMAQLARIDRFHTERFARLLALLAGAAEGERDLLASCAVVYGCAIGDGDRHDHHDLPILLAGELGGALRPARHVAYPRETPLNDLHLALMAAWDVRPTHFGDGSGPLEGLG